MRRTLRAARFITVAPIVTWPSPAMTTLPWWRRARMVVLRTRTRVLMDVPQQRMQNGHYEAGHAKPANDSTDSPLFGFSFPVFGVPSLLRSFHALGCALSYTLISWSRFTWVYFCVVDRLACPSSSWMARRSAPAL